MKRKHCVNFRYVFVINAHSYIHLFCVLAASHHSQNLENLVSFDKISTTYRLTIYNLDKMKIKPCITIHDVFTHTNIPND